jgi:hypothetical protein
MTHDPTNLVYDELLGGEWPSKFMTWDHQPFILAADNFLEGLSLQEKN